MKSLVAGLAAASLVFGAAVAQTTTTGTGTAGTTTMSPAAGTMGSPAPMTGSTVRPMSGTTAAPRVGGQAAASGDTNQAVATTSANAPTPAHGKNSFTMGQARSRIQARGYAQVAGLKKDTDGVWRGQGQKDGAPVTVWLDYKGNVGQQ